MADKAQINLVCRLEGQVQDVQDMFATLVMGWDCPAEG